MPPFAAGVAAPLLAVPQFADGSWGKELSGWARGKFTEIFRIGPPVKIGLGIIILAVG